MPFITFDGPDGSGKSTQIARLAKRLTAQGLDVIVTKNPGGTPYGQCLRAITQSNTKLTPLTLALLFLSDRAHHIDTMIKPALEKGVWVLCDRFTDSTIAYQGYGQGLDIPTLENFCKLVVGSTTPELTCLLLLNPDESMARIKARCEQTHEELNRWDLLDFESRNRIYKGFIQIMVANQKRMRCFDATLSVTELEEKIYETVAYRFNLP